MINYLEQYKNYHGKIIKQSSMYAYKFQACGWLI